MSLYLVVFGSEVCGVKNRLELFVVKRLSSISHSVRYRLIINEVSGVFSEHLSWMLVTLLLSRISSCELGRWSLK